MAVNNSTQLPELFLRIVRQGTTMRTQSLQALNTALQNQTTALKFEQVRTSSLFGAHSHQAILVRERMLDQAALSRAIAAELLRSRVRVPVPSGNQFVVYGRVLDNAGQPLKNIQVAAIDPEGAVVLTAVSDASGRFELRVPAPAPAPAPAGAPAPIPRAAAGARARKQAQAPPETFQLLVSDKTGETSLTYPELLQPIAGMLAYREITMP